MKKVKILVLAMLAIFTISGCSGKVTTESLMKEANANVEKVESVQMKVGMDMKAEIAIMGMRVDMDMKADIDMRTTKEPLVAHTSGIISMNVLGESDSTVLESYAEQDGSDSIVYSKMENGTWQKTTGLSIENTADLFTEQEIENMLEALELADDTESINQIECYQISGEVAGSAISESINHIFGGQEGMEMFAEMDLSNASVPVKYYISKTERRPVKLSMDLKDIIQDALEKTLQTLMGDEGMNIDMNMDIDNCLMEITYVSFDSIDEIEIPAAAKKATEADTTEVGSTENGVDEISEQELIDILAGNEAEEIEDATKEVEDATEEVEDVTEEGADVETATSKSTGTSVLDDNAVKINGQTVTFPCSIEDLLATGLELDEEDNRQVSSQDYEFVYADIGDSSRGRLYFYVYNDTDEAKDAFDCPVGGFNYTCRSDAYKMDIELEFHQGLRIGEPIEKAVQLYGEPNARNIYEDYATYTWENRDTYFNRCSLKSDEDDNVVEYEFTNFAIDW